MLAWPHSGFHVHTAVWVPEDDPVFTFIWRTVPAWSKT